MTIEDEQKVDVALKYLELARSEIIYRVKSLNDTLIVYAGAVGAISAWVYKAYHDSPPNGSKELTSSFPPLALSAGLVVSFLALAASWIIFHNERMITALANYQREELDCLVRLTGITPWECSQSLRDGDKRSLSLFATIVYSGLVVGPSVIGCYEMWLHGSRFPHQESYLVMSGAMTIVAGIFMIRMIVDRWKLRAR